MAEKRKTKKKGQDIPIEEENNPTKIEYAVASYLKRKVSTKKTKFLNHQVNYFYANKAIDILLESSWATGKDLIFTDRQSVVNFCNKLLQHKFFHRARKIPITDKDLKLKELKKKKEKEKEDKKKKDLPEWKKKKLLEKEEEEKEKEKENEKEKEKENENEKAQEQKNEGETTDAGADEGKEKEKKKKKAKIKLDMHLDQVFLDSSDAYVWMYDPVPFWYYIAGALCLFGAIAVCLFPLWPPAVRKGVYYLSLAAAGFLGVILSLAVIRFIVFVIIWALSMGRHHFWLLPNLTEDVGFFASFWPLYYYEYRSADYKKKKSKKKKREEEEEEDENEREQDDIDQDKKSDGEDAFDSNYSAGETDKPETDVDKAGEQTAHSETDSENSNSQTFEMVNKEDLSNGGREE